MGQSTNPELIVTTSRRDSYVECSKLVRDFVVAINPCEAFPRAQTSHGLIVLMVTISKVFLSNMPKNNVLDSSLLTDFNSQA